MFTAQLLIISLKTSFNILKNKFYNLVQCQKLKRNKLILEVVDGIQQVVESIHAWPTLYRGYILKANVIQTSRMSKTEFETVYAASPIQDVDPLPKQPFLLHMALQLEGWTKKTLQWTGHVIVVFNASSTSATTRRHLATQRAGHPQLRHAAWRLPPAPPPLTWSGATPGRCLRGALPPTCNTDI
jgi:hypothetical protein